MLNKGGEKKKRTYMYICTDTLCMERGKKKNRTGKDKYVILIIVHADCFFRHVVLEFVFFFCFLGI